MLYRIERCQRTVEDVIGTWCEDNGHSADGCDCGVCGSYGSCSRWSCPTDLEPEGTRLFLGQELVQCPDSAQAEMPTQVSEVTEDECVAHNGSFTEAADPWCEDGRLNIPISRHAAGQVRSRAASRLSCIPRTR